MRVRGYLVSSILLAALAACSSDHTTPAGVASTAKQTSSKLGVASAGAAAAHSFATLPDRGELLAYDHVQRVKHSGAYTAYPVSLSEAHALNAIKKGGQLVVKAPNGELIHLKYERHVEHPDGNWSWIGRNADGADAVLTFGEKAVFGTIPQGASDMLRLTMSAGQSWLVEADRSKLAGLDGSQRGDRSDMLIPPSTAAAASSHSTASMRAESATADATANAVTPRLVDVVLGYSTGLATKLGGDSAAITRMVSLIDTTNQAYANSGITMRVRLVKALSVNYADATDNGDALEKLTGYKAGSGNIPVDPAFNALRAARDQYGADLVSFVRKFQTPQNNGCGIAWLLGGGGKAITASDAPFAYSVVSDGTDLDEGDNKTYFCREETLAHEFGHNMGQAHNKEDSDQSGTDPYSYGYRQSSNGGFYTVMAYPKKDASQYSIRYFANPNVQYNGAATGVADQSDNTRSMNQTMPIVAAFRATIVPVAYSVVRNDVDGDGRSDILWRNSGAELFLSWNMNGATFVSSGSTYMVNSYYVAATGDFNGDGKVDLLWKNDTAKVLYMAFSGPTGYTLQYVRTFPAGWNLVGAGDVDGDGKADLLWRNTQYEQFSYWLMDGAQLKSSKAFYMVNTYSVAASGDFNGDGKLDILWVRPGYNLYMWMGNGTDFELRYVGPHSAGWNVVGAGDVDGDGKDDIFLRNSATEQLRYMIMDGPQTVRQADQYMVNTYSVAAIGDYDGDNHADVLWIRPGYNLYQWMGNGTNFSLQYVAIHPGGWAVVPAVN